MPPKKAAKKAAEKSNFQSCLLQIDRNRCWTSRYCQSCKGRASPSWIIYQDASWDLRGRENCASFDFWRSQNFHCGTSNCKCNIQTFVWCYTLSINKNKNARGFPSFSLNRVLINTSFLEPASQNCKRRDTRWRKANLPRIWSNCWAIRHTEDSSST